MKRAIVSILLFISLLLLSGAPPERAFAADAIEIVSINYPSIVTPGASIPFTVTVKVNEGQLLHDRGDMLRNVDGNTYGHWPHIEVNATVNSGQTYTFQSYGNGLTAPMSEGIYRSVWQVWRDGHYDGPQVVIQFTVKIGGGGGDPYPVYQTSYGSPCIPTSASHGIDPGTDGRDHWYIDLRYDLPSDIEVREDLGAFTTNTDLIAYMKEINETIKWIGPNQTTYAGEPHKVPDDTYRVYLWTRKVGTIVNIFGIRFFNFDNTLHNEWLNHPENLAFFYCKYTGEPSPSGPSSDRYPILQNYSIAQPEPGTQYAYAFSVPVWMTTINATMRMGSHAILTFKDPNGNIFTQGTPGVDYVDTPDYASITLNNVTPGDWQFVVDTTEATYDTIFYFTISGAQSADAPGDGIPPITIIQVNGTMGENNWYTSDVTVVPIVVDPGGSGVASTEYSMDHGQTWTTVSNGVITLTREGINHLAVRSTDNAGNTEMLWASKTIYIDKTPPIIHAWIDPPLPKTRIDPYTIRYDFSDAPPGSGICDHTATFNNMNVEPDQVIDLLLYHLGTYTLTVTAKDCAGLVTTQSVSFDLIATLESMKGALARFCSEGYITDWGLCNSLTQKLDAAIAARDRNRLNTAINILGAFRAEVTAQTGKKIPANIAELLHEDAIYVIDQLQAP